MFLTKADTLAFIKDRVKKSRVEDIMIITGKEFLENENQSAFDIKKRFGDNNIVIRSSSSNEDSLRSSNAGHYESVLNVPAGDESAVKKAVQKVLASYKKDMDNIDSEQVLIQRQTKKISCSGVIFSKDIKLKRPYYVISYDTQSTDAVTSGSGGKTLYIARSANLRELPSSWAALIDAVRELEDIFPEYPLDIEFAIDENNDVIIFQVRPLAACINDKNDNISDENIKNVINEAEISYQRICDKMYEKETILSDMAFWNPAEIIGENPHPLDYSLYREIITKEAWNQGLNYIGYKTVDGELMYKIGNKPYISLHQSFLCLMPDDLDAELEKKLLNYYNEKLLSDITAHDKIEFEIVFSAYDFTTKDRLLGLLDYGFTKSEIEDLEQILFNLTNNAICNFKRNRMKDIRSLNGLRVHRENIRRNLVMCEKDTNMLIRYFNELIESIKQYGTPKFARQARLAFISKALCKSLVAKGYFTDREIDAFMMSIYTVASEYDADFQDYADGKITRVSFDEKYGHLRSGTYDITCETYAEREFDTSKGSEMARKQRQHVEGLKENPLNTMKLMDALEDIGFYVDAKDFAEFLSDSMEEREYFKFEFTKSLSLAIDILIDIGKILQISKEDMAYLTVDDIIAVADKSPEYIKDNWTKIIEKNKEKYILNSAMILPDVIYNKKQLNCIRLTEARPNFITSEIVTGEVLVLENEENREKTDLSASVRDKIVVIPKADPGYDWIFAKGIKGFITKYGGVASHMAIRCAEFNIPAAIGCGDVIYNYVTGLKRLTLDCKSGRILKED